MNALSNRNARTLPGPLFGLLPGLLALAAGCDGADFDSRLELEGYRVIGVEAEPPAVTSTGQFTLTAHEFNETADAIAHAWSLCLVDPGVAADVACLDQDLEVEFAGGAVLDVDLGPGGIDLAARLSAAGPQFTPGGAPARLDDGFDVLVTLRSGGACDGCRQVTTFKRVHVRDGAGASANDNPRISAFEVGGEVQPGAVLSLEAITDTPQAYVDPVDGAERPETYLYTWYSSLGEADPGLTFDARNRTELTIPEDAGDGQAFEVVVAVRDGRGGLAVARETLTTDRR